MEFEKLTANEKLNEVLKVLYTKKTGSSIPELAGHFYPTLLTMEPSRLYITEMLEFLNNDGYTKRDNQSIFTITFKGRQFIENGGYVASHQDKEIERNKAKVNELILRNAAVGAAVGAIALFALELLKFLIDYEIFY